MGSVEWYMKEVEQAVASGISSRDEPSGGFPIGIHDESEDDEF